LFVVEFEVEPDHTITQRVQGVGVAVGAGSCSMSLAMMTLGLVSSFVCLGATF